MNREEYINLAINLNKFMYGDFKKLYRFKTREEFEKRIYEHNVDVYSIAYKNELFADLTKGDFFLLKEAGVISDMTESKDGIFQDASDYFVINEAQFRLVAERRIYRCKNRPQPPHQPNPRSHGASHLPIVGC